MAEELRITGILRGVNVTNPPDKTWIRASLKIEEVNGQTKTLGTFDKDAIKKANELNGKEVTAIYKVEKGFNNLVGTSISEKGQGEQPITQEEKVEDPNQKTLTQEEGRKIDPEYKQPVVNNTVVNTVAPIKTENKTNVPPATVTDYALKEQNKYLYGQILNKTIDTINSERIASQINQELTTAFEKGFDSTFDLLWDLAVKKRTEKLGTKK